MIRSIVRWFVISTIVAWIMLDIYVYLRFGNPATESASFVRWSFYHPWIPFLAGLLCGHMFFDLREPIDWKKDYTKEK